MGIVGIERFNRAEAASGLELWGLVDATANESRHIMREKANAVAIHAVARAVHHGARCRIGGRGICSTC